MAHKDSVRSIQNRLFLLLLRGFVIALLFLLLFVLLTTAFVLSNPSRNNPLFRLPILSQLETYYIGRGSWDGVTRIFANGQNFEGAQWRSSILLDAQNRIVVQNGVAMAPGTTVLYQPRANEVVVPIVVEGVTVGHFVASNQATPPERRYTYNFLQPVILASVLLAIFAAIIGLLLTRRIVAPLAEVIAAAEEIAAGGNLHTRVSVEGPDDMRALSDSFNKMADTLERNDRERRDMLADIAHELRTPLTVLRGRLEGILDGVYPADESHVVPALEETYLLERLVEDLRLLTLAETHQLPFEKHDVDLASLAQRTLTLFQAEAEDKKINLSVDTRVDTAVVSVDPQRTEQVVGNLISNALRYVPEGGHVWLTVEQRADQIVLKVSDNGPGIPAEDLPFIFNRFWRGDKSRSRASGGAGLGLAIARQLVTGQGGSIAAANLPEGGLQILITFPVKA